QTVSRAPSPSPGSSWERKLIFSITVSQARSLIISIRPTIPDIGSIHISTMATLLMMESIGKATPSPYKTSIFPDTGLTGILKM
ncbi:MAG: hypothetical protein IKX03_06875, partial [Bacteroidales bacterium]|nr:hypothetical protein [Bacteroidales bacterium]